MGRFTFILFFVLCVSSASFGQSANSFKVVNYNALHGFRGDSLLKERYINWINEIDPDIVSYQEMNGFMQNDIGALAEAYGHPYAVIMNEEYGVPVTHPLAITSKYPILNVERVIDNMWHGYLYAYIEGVHVFVTHLAPFTLKDRQKDITQILAQAALLPQDEKILIAGDFNALSPKDSAVYSKSGLLEAMKKSEGRYEPKSGTPIVRGRTIYRNNLNNDRIDYSVMQKILDAGYKDTYYLANDRFKDSVPARGHASKNSVLRRIDYIWVNEKLAKHLESADIIQDEITDELSDHYPVVVEFNFKKDGK